MYFRILTHHACWSAGGSLEVVRKPAFCKDIDKRHEPLLALSWKQQAFREDERLPEGDQKGMCMHRSLFVSILQATDLRSTRARPAIPPTQSPAAAALRWVDGGLVTSLIYLAAAAQLLNLLLATYATQLLGHQDLLLSIFGSWGLAVFVKLLALGLWLIYREFLEARFTACLIAPISVFALLHDILMLA
jgi:hypothetical protein